MQGHVAVFTAIIGGRKIEEKVLNKNCDSATQVRVMLDSKMWSWKQDH